MSTRPTVVPAVIPSSRRVLDDTLGLFATFTEEAQVDIVDGVFVVGAPKSWPYVSDRAIYDQLDTVTFDALAIELDLMIDRPEETLNAWQRTGATRIIVHVESTKRLDDIIAHAAVSDYTLGLAFNNDTDLSLLSTVDLTHVGFIQLMGIAKIGEQGLPFDERVLSRIVWVREHYPELVVSIDGAVGPDTIVRLHAAGATRFVSGSDILTNDDPAQEYRTLMQLVSGVKQ